MFCSDLIRLKTFQFLMQTLAPKLTHLVSCSIVSIAQCIAHQSGSTGHHRTCPIDHGTTNILRSIHNIIHNLQRGNRRREKTSPSFEAPFLVLDLFQEKQGFLILDTPKGTLAATLLSNSCSRPERPWRCKSALSGREGEAEAREAREAGAGGGDGAGAQSFSISSLCFSCYTYIRCFESAPKCFSLNVCSNKSCGTFHLSTICGGRKLDVLALKAIGSGHCHVQNSKARNRMEEGASRKDQQGHSVPSFP